MLPYAKPSHGGQCCLFGWKHSRAETTFFFWPLCFSISSMCPGPFGKHLQDVLQQQQPLQPSGGPASVSREEGGCKHVRLNSQVRRNQVCKNQVETRTSDCAVRKATFIPCLTIANINTLVSQALLAQARIQIKAEDHKQHDRTREGGTYPPLVPHAEGTKTASMEKDIVRSHILNLPPLQGGIKT